MFNQVLKDCFVNFMNFLKKYLIYCPFEKASSFNGKILYKYSYKTKMKNNLCVFSHFDKDRMIDDYVVYYVQKLSQQGFDIVFVSTSEKLLQGEIKKISPYCRDILIKENIGYDFGAWQTGITYLKGELDKYDTLLLCNDSVYAPFYPFDEMFDVMQGKYDFWGITDSYEIYHHLQSYFMVFDKKVFTSKLFKRIWENYKIYTIKRNIILHYEVGISQKLLKNGYSMGVYSPFDKLNTTKIRNASHYHWKELIEKFRCPMIKVELLRDNPKNIDISKWEEVIENKTNFKIYLIKKHLNRMKYI